jgi:hypothetical protein
VKGHETVGDSTITRGSTTIDLPSGSADVNGTAQASFDGSKVSGAVSGTAKVHEDVNDVKLGPLDLPGSAVDVTASGRVAADPTGITARGRVTGGAKLTKDGTLDLGTANGGITADTKIHSGTGVSVDASFNHTPGQPVTQVNGQANAQLSTDTSVQAHSGKLDATLNSDANVGVSAPFAGTIGTDKKITIDPTKTSATIPVKIGFLAGTQISWNEPGKVTSFTLTNSDSYIQFSTPVAFGANGLPVLHEIDGIDVVLAAGPSQIMFLGNGITIPAGNQLHVKGKVVITPQGLQVTGMATVGVNFGVGQPVSFTINF